MRARRTYTLAGHRRVAHTEELALIICTLQIYNTTIHTSVGAETQEGRSLREAWLAGRLPVRPAASLCLSVKPVSRFLLLLSLPFPSFSLPISVPLLASSAIPASQFLFSPRSYLLLLLCLPTGGEPKIDAQNIALLPDATNIYKFTKGTAAQPFLVFGSGKQRLPGDTPSFRFFSSRTLGRTEFSFRFRLPRSAMTRSHPARK